MPQKAIYSHTKNDNHIHGDENPIRPMNIDEEDELQRVEEIWFNGSVKVHNWMDNPEDYWDKRRQNFRNETTDYTNRKFVYVEKGKITGFITAKGNHILELFVDKDFQGKGIGTKLIKPMIDAQKPPYVNVYMLNDEAIQFYIKNNFVITKIYSELDTGFTKFIMEYKKGLSDRKNIPT